jgi:hypothetical protein
MKYSDHQTKYIRKYVGLRTYQHPCSCCSCPVTASMFLKWASQKSQCPPLSIWLSYVLGPLACPSCLAWQFHNILFFSLSSHCKVPCQFCQCGMSCCQVLCCALCVLPQVDFLHVMSNHKVKILIPQNTSVSWEYSVWILPFLGTTQSLCQLPDILMGCKILKMAF